ncbi:unnamed protein product [Rotaria magnacalcarata]
MLTVKKQCPTTTPTTTGISNGNDHKILNNPSGEIIPAVVTTNSITKQVEKKVGVYLNGDVVIGSGMNYSQAQGGADEGTMNQLENVIHMDLNGDGRVGGGGVGNASQYN